MTTLADLVNIVRQSRERTAGVFPLPDVDSCIDYAITEAGEFLDTVLREQRDTDKRNRDKDHDARKELAQCGYMICSAIIQVPTDHLDATDWESYVPIASMTLYRLMRTLTEVRDGTNKRWENPHVDAFDEWHAFVGLCGYNPADLLRETCAAFEAKHLRQPFRYPVLSAEEAAKQGEQAD